MRYVLILAVVAGGLFYWKSRQAPPPEPAPVEQRDTAPAANAQNRVNHLSGAAPLD